MEGWGIFGSRGAVPGTRQCALLAEASRLLAAVIALSGSFASSYVPASLFTCVPYLDT